MATHFVPVNAQAVVGQLGAMPALDGCSAPPAAGTLSDWRQDDYDLDAHLAGKLGFALGGTSATSTQRLLIREFSRSAVCEGEEGKRYRYGTAVRLVVKISSADARANLNIPLVAAETQVGRMQAESTLRVVGYVGGGLAALLPPFRTFNVDAYAELSTQMNEIKKLIGEDSANVQPTKLGVEITTEEKLDVGWALGLAWGLTCIKNRKSCQQAKRDYRDAGSDSALRAIEQAYLSYARSFGLQ